MFDVLEDLLANKPWLVSLFYRVRKRTVEITNIFFNFSLRRPPYGLISFNNRLSREGLKHSHVTSPTLLFSILTIWKKCFLNTSEYINFFPFFSFIISKQVCLRKINYLIIFQPWKKVFNSEISSFNFVFF